MTVKRWRFAAVGAALIVCAPVAAQVSQPSDDFLEYLAALVDQDGEWVDPLELDELPEELPEETLDTTSNPDTSHDNTQPAEETQ